MEEAHKGSNQGGATSQDAREGLAGRRKQEPARPSVIKRSVKLWISYMEIYNENVNDLLDPSKRNLPIREGRNREVVIEGLSRFEVKDVEAAFRYLREGNQAK